MAQLQVRFGDRVRCTLHRGDRGVFDVLADGQRIFSKDLVGRFPKRDEIGDLIDGLLP